MNMLGNWQTIGSCFLTSSWHVSTDAQFAGTCIGVFLIVVLIELIRRWGREYDRHIAGKMLVSAQKVQQGRGQSFQSPVSIEDGDRTKEQTGDFRTAAAACRICDLKPFYGPAHGTALRPAQLRPTVWQQTLRSTIFGLQFAGAYIVMLIAMSFNGYILVSIIAGGISGHFVSTWDSFENGGTQDLSASDLSTVRDNSDSVSVKNTYGPTVGACCN